MKNDFCSGYLEHHGIMGQKWGVRNGPPYPLDTLSKSSSEKKSGSKTKLQLTDNQKAILKGIAITAGVVGVGVASYYILRKTSAKEIAKMIPAMGSSGPAIESKAKEIIKRNIKDTDIVLNKGLELYKANVDKNFDVSKTTDVIYSSYDKLDRIAYRYGLFDWRKNPERYEAVFKATDDLVGPSKDTAKEIFDKLYNSSSEYHDNLETALANYYAKGYRLRSGFKELTDEQLFEKGLRYAKEDLARDPFKYGMQHINNNDKISKILVNEFKKAGYDFVEDYQDKNVFSRHPIVLLDNSKIKQEGVQWYNYYNKANRALAKKILIKNKHGGAFGWGVDSP